MEILLLFTFCQWGNSATEKLNNLPKIEQLVGWLRAHAFSHSVRLPHCWSLMDTVTDAREHSTASEAQELTSYEGGGEQTGTSAQWAHWLSGPCPKSTTKIFFNRFAGLYVSLDTQRWQIVRATGRTRAKRQEDSLGNSSNSPGKRWWLLELGETQGDRENVLWLRDN